jgi:hypothetical protein
MVEEGNGTTENKSRDPKKVKPFLPTSCHTFPRIPLDITPCTPEIQLEKRTDLEESGELNNIIAAPSWSSNPTPPQICQHSQAA